MSEKKTGLGLATKAKAILVLSDHLEHTISIECGGCGDGTNALATTEWDAAKELYADGWRVVECDASAESRCPKCVAANEEAAGL